MNVPELLDKLEEARELRDSARNELIRLREDVIPADVLKRIEEIEAEFLPSINAMSDKISALEAMIVKHTLEHGDTIRGSVLMAVHRSGSVTWEKKILETLAKEFPKINAAKKIGKPSVSIQERKDGGKDDE